MLRRAPPTSTPSRRGDATTLCLTLLTASSLARGGEIRINERIAELQGNLAKQRSSFANVENTVSQLLSSEEALLSEMESYLPRRPTLQRAANFNFREGAPIEASEQIKEAWAQLLDDVRDRRQKPRISPDRPSAGQESINAAPVLPPAVTISQVSKPTHLASPESLPPPVIASPESRPPTEGVKFKIDTGAQGPPPAQGLPAQGLPAQGLPAHGVSIGDLMNPQESYDAADLAQAFDILQEAALNGKWMNPLSIPFSPPELGGTSAIITALYSKLQQSTDNVWRLERRTVSLLESLTPIGKRKVGSPIETPSSGVPATVRLERLSAKIDDWFNDFHTAAIAEKCRRCRPDGREDCGHGDFLCSLRKTLDARSSNLQLLHFAWLHLCAEVYADVVARESAEIERAATKNGKGVKDMVDLLENKCWKPGPMDLSIVSDFRLYWKREVMPAWGCKSKEFSYQDLQNSFSDRARLINETAKQLLDFTFNRHHGLPFINPKIKIEDVGRRFELGRHLYLDLKHRTREMVGLIFKTLLDLNRRTLRRSSDASTFYQSSSILLQDLQLISFEDLVELDQAASSRTVTPSELNPPPDSRVLRKLANSNSASMSTRSSLLSAGETSPVEDDVSMITIPACGIRSPHDSEGAANALPPERLPPAPSAVLLRERTKPNIPVTTPLRPASPLYVAPIQRNSLPKPPRVSSPIYALPVQKKDREKMTASAQKPLTPCPPAPPLPCPYTRPVSSPPPTGESVPEYAEIRQ